jgi:uncharacterized membrane protein
MTLGRALLGGGFIVTGTLHFVITEQFEAIMPPYVPAHREMVLVSGVAEIAGGAALLIPGLERPARWWLLALLAAVFPANVHMAVNPEEIKGLSVPTWALWARLPLQAVLAACVVGATRRR